jgi:hypothetical protein
MRTEVLQTPFEVRCQHCRVTFPVGTRSCLHCGRRISGRRGQLVTGLPATATPGGVEDEQVLLEEGMPRPAGGMLSPRVWLWLLLAAAVGIQRACYGG